MTIDHDIKNTLATEIVERAKARGISLERLPDYLGVIAGDIRASMTLTPVADAHREEVPAVNVPVENTDAQQ